MFDHEKLDVYQVELSFVAWLTPLLDEVKNIPQGLHREVSDQLDRASLSALLNTAEGNGRRQSKQRAKFFDDARGSTVECAACLDALVAKKLASAHRIKDGKAMLLRIVGMLSKLVDRFDDFPSRVREDPDDLEGEIEAMSARGLQDVTEPENPPRPRRRPSSSKGGSAGRAKRDEDEGRGGGGPTR